MSDLNIASNAAIQTAVSVYERINDVFKSFGIVAGGIAASLADWLFGAVTMGILLSNYPNFSKPWIEWGMGGIFSLALWGIQIILWQVVLTGKIGKIAANRSTSATIYVVVFIGIIAMKLGDDFSDIVGVYWLIKDNPMQFFLKLNIYQTLLGVIFFLVWAICGFAEVFVALSINMLKDSGGGGGNGGNKGNENRGGGGGGGNGQRHQQRQFNPQPSHGGGMAHRAQLEKAYHGPDRRGQNKPTPTAASRPLYNEPTYRPMTRNLNEEDDERENGA